MRLLHNASNRGMGTLLVALGLAGTVQLGTIIYSGVWTLMDPAASFAYWTRLTGGRALWVSKRPACSQAQAPQVCQYAGLSDDSPLSVSYFPPRRRRRSTVCRWSGAAPLGSRLPNNGGYHGRYQRQRAAAP